MTADLDLSDLISGGKKEKDKKPTEWHAQDGLPKGFHYGRGQQPEALVLAVVTTICEICGARYRYPSRWLLLRYKALNYTWTTSTVDSVSTAKLPREIVYHEVPCNGCERCFPEVPAERTYIRRLNEATISRSSEDTVRELGPACNGQSQGAGTEPCGPSVAVS